MLDSTVSLNEMEEKLEHILQSSRGRIRILADFKLSGEDYKILCLRLRGFAKYQKNIRIYEKYRLSLICAGVYAFQYEATITKALKKVEYVFKNIPQYMQRKFFNIFENLLEENGLSTYGIHIVDIRTLEQALVIQSGISEEACKKIFQYCEAEKDVAVEEMLLAISWKEFGDSLNVLDDILKKRMLVSVVEAYQECSQKELSCVEIAKMYPEHSMNFICCLNDYCSMKRMSGRKKLVK